MGHNNRAILFLIVTALLLGLMLQSCTADQSLSQPPAEKPKVMTPGRDEVKFTLSSQAFREGEKIPAKYTCSGQNISPPLSWTEPPTGTKSLALVVDDLEAPFGIFTHWVIFNIEHDIIELPEAVPTEEQLPNGTLQCRNSFQRIGYSGPVPPPGNPHRYEFTLNALDRVLDLKAGTSKDQLINAIKGHILAQGKLTGIFQR